MTFHCCDRQKEQHAEGDPAWRNTAPQGLSQRLHIVILFQEGRTAGPRALREGGAVTGTEGALQRPHCSTEQAVAIITTAASLLCKERG